MDNYNLSLLYVRFGRSRSNPFRYAEESNVGKAATRHSFDWSRSEISMKCLVLWKGPER